MDESGRRCHSRPKSHSPSQPAKGRGLYVPLQILTALKYSPLTARSLLATEYGYIDLTEEMRFKLEEVKDARAMTDRVAFLILEAVEVKSGCESRVVRAGVLMMLRSSIK